MWEPFTEDARKTITRANEIARQNYSKYICTGCFAIAIIETLCGNNIFVAVKNLLQKFGITLDAVKAKIVILKGSAEQYEGYCFTVKTKLLIEKAFAMAKKFNSRNMNTIHFLLTIFDTECRQNEILSDMLGDKKSSFLSELIELVPEIQIPERKEEPAKEFEEGIWGVGKDQITRSIELPKSQDSQEKLMETKLLSEAMSFQGFLDEFIQDYPCPRKRTRKSCHKSIISQRVLNISMLLTELIGLFQAIPIEEAFKEDRQA